MSTQTQKTAAKAAKTATAGISYPFEAFNFNMPSMDVPASLREIAEKSVAQARDAYAKLKSAAEDATGLVENTLETAREGAFSLGVKALDAAKSNSDASFALARDLIGAKTFAEVIEIQSSFARKAFESLTAQAKEFSELTQKVVSDTAKPVTAQVEKTFREMRAA
ncbi:MAG TPA: phasin [Bauldia sp.]|nr:phasin [Bauldia sp.]